MSVSTMLVSKCLAFIWQYVIGRKMECASRKRQKTTLRKCFNAFWVMSDLAHCALVLCFNALHLGREIGTTINSREIGSGTITSDYSNEDAIKSPKCHYCNKMKHDNVRSKNLCVCMEKIHCACERASSPTSSWRTLNGGTSGVPIWSPIKVTSIENWKVLGNICNLLSFPPLDLCSFSQLLCTTTALPSSIPMVCLKVTLVHVWSHIKKSAVISIICIICLFSNN